MNDLRELYEEVILDHNRNPRNFGPLPDATHHGHGYNPLCGDEVEIHLKVVDGCIAAVSFQGDGCAISTASASLMTEALLGKNLAEAQHIFERLHTTLTDKSIEPDLDQLGKVAVLSGVREYPMRVKCATLAWHTLQAALDNSADSVTTE